MQVEDIYQAVGDEGIARLVNAFYKRVPADPVLGPMYPANDLSGAEERLRDFLRFRFGGPPDYLETRGHPRLRMRHAPFAVNAEARDHWLLLMSTAFEEAGWPDDAKLAAREFFLSTANFLLNRHG